MEHGGLEGVKARVEPDFLMEVCLHAAVGAQTHQAVEQRLVLRDHHAAIAESAKVLRRKKRERADRGPFTGHGPRAADLTTGTNRLRGILDDRQRRQQAANLLNRRDLAEEVNGNDRPGPARHRRRRKIRANIERLRVDVHEHRRGTDIVDRTRGGEERERRRHDLVAAPDVQRPQPKEERVGAVRAANGVPRVRQRGHLPLQLLHRRAKDECLVVDDRQQGLQHFVPYRGVLGPQVEQGNGHRMAIRFVMCNH